MKARTNVIVMAAETRVFKKLSEETKGKFSVSLDQSHLTRLIMECAPPPALLLETAKPALVEIGFREARSFRKFGLAPGDEDDRDVLVTIGPGNGEYRCPRCEARAEELPSQCGTCQLSLVSWHDAAKLPPLFPVMPFVEVKVDGDSKDEEEEEKKRQKER